VDYARFVNTLFRVAARFCASCFENAKAQGCHGAKKNLILALYFYGARRGMVTNPKIDARPPRRQGARQVEQIVVPSHVCALAFVFGF